MADWQQNSDDQQKRNVKVKKTEDGDTAGFRNWRGIRYFYQHPGRFWFAVFFGIAVALCFIPPMAPAILPLLLLGKLVFTSAGLIAASAVIAFISGFLASQIIAITSAFFRIGEGFREGFRWLNAGIRSIVYWGVFVPIACISWALGWVNAGFKWLINILLKKNKAHPNNLAATIENQRGKPQPDNTPPSIWAKALSIIPYILWFSFGLAAFAVFIPAAIVGFVFWGIGIVLQAIGKIGRIFSKCAEFIGNIRGTKRDQNPKAPVLKTAAHFILAALAFPFACLVELGQAFVFSCAKTLLMLNIPLGLTLIEQKQMRNHPRNKTHMIDQSCVYQPRCFADGLVITYRESIEDTESREVLRYDENDQYKGGIDTVPRDIFNAVNEGIVLDLRTSGDPGVPEEEAPQSSSSI